MLYKKVLIAFAFVAITSNVANGSPIDTPLQDVQGLVPSLTNLDNLQDLNPQTLSSLSSNDKSSLLSLNDLNSKLSSSTQSLPVGGDSGDKTSDLNVNNVNQFLSSDALSGTQSSTNNNAQRRDDTTGQSNLIPNTDSLKDSITKILSSVKSSNLGGQSEKSTDTGLTQSETLLRRHGHGESSGIKGDGEKPPTSKRSFLTRAQRSGVKGGGGMRVVPGKRSFLPRGDKHGVIFHGDGHVGARSFLPRAETGRKHYTGKDSFLPRADTVGTTITTGRHRPGKRSSLYRAHVHGDSDGGDPHPGKRSLIHGPETYDGKSHPGKRSFLPRSEPKIGGDEPHLDKVSKAILSRDEASSPTDSLSFLRRARGKGVKGYDGDFPHSDKVSRAILSRDETITRGDSRLRHPGKRSEAILSRDETSSPMNSLSQLQIQQITSQIMDSINKAMPMGSTGDMTSPTSTSGTTSTTNNVLPNVRRDDTTGQSNLMPNTDSLKDSITKILSSMNLSNEGSDSSSMPSQNNVSPQKRSMDSKENLYKRLSMDWFSSKPKQPTVKKDRRDENMPLQNKQITNQIMDQINQFMGSMNMQNTKQDSSSTSSSTDSFNDQ